MNLTLDTLQAIHIYPLCSPVLGSQAQFIIICTTLLFICKFIPMTPCMVTHFRSSSSIYKLPYYTQGKLYHGNPKLDTLYATLDTLYATLCQVLKFKQLYYYYMFSHSIQREIYTMLTLYHNLHTLYGTLDTLYATLCQVLKLNLLAYLLLNYTQGNLYILPQTPCMVPQTPCMIPQTPSMLPCVRSTDSI